MSPGPEGRRLNKSVCQMPKSARDPRKALLFVPFGWRRSTKDTLNLFQVPIHFQTKNNYKKKQWKTLKRIPPAQACQPAPGMPRFQWLHPTSRDLKRGRAPRCALQIGWFFKYERRYESGGWQGPFAFARVRIVPIPVTIFVAMKSIKTHELGPVESWWTWEIQVFDLLAM